MDKNTTLKQIKDEAVEFRNKRGWDKGHNPDVLAKSIIIEAAELLEIFQWDTNNLEIDEQDLQKISHEVADILIYIFSLTDILNLDISEAVKEKLEHNRKKYPLKYFNQDKHDEEYYQYIKKKYREKD